MDLQKRRTFIISFIYFAIIGVICYILFKRLIPMLMPFIMALAIAAALDPAVSILTAAWASIRQVTGRLVKAYALLMALTFAELFVGFWVLGVPMGFTAACLITLVDILPVLGTGTVLLPWAFIAWTTGSGSLGIGLVCLYLLITVVRQTLEPKVVGLQMGLPPAAALLCMFVGGKVLGLAGIFLFPIGATVLFELSEDGTIQLFK